MNPRDFAERALLGVLLHEPGRIRDLPWLESSDFRAPSHQTVHATLHQLVDEHDAAQPDPEASEFDFHRDVLGDDLVVGGVAYDATEWRLEEGEPVRLSRGERDQALAANDAELAHQDAQHHHVPGVTPVTVWERIQNTAEHGSAQDDAVSPAGLHTLMQTAPASSVAQPDAYAAIVLEASIRRQVQAAGMRVGQAAETSPELTSMLGEVDHALTLVDDAQQRWNEGTGTHTITLPTEATRERPTEVTLEDTQTTLDQDTIDSAEYGVVESVLIDPTVLDALALRVEPGDFANTELGNTYRAAQEVHAGRTTTGHDVDPITVAWQQQRQEPQHGPGLSIEDLAGMGRVTALGNGNHEHNAERVLRGSLSRLTSRAAETVQQAAQTPGLQPDDVLHTSHLALNAIQHTAERMSPARTAGLASPVPITQALAADSGPGHRESPSRASELTTRHDQHHR